MGGIRAILSLMPGMGTNAALKNMDMGEKELVKVEAIIRSMTAEERLKPKIIAGPRRKRIATGSGATIQDVNSLLNRFETIKKIAKKTVGSNYTPSAKDKKKHGKHMKQKSFSPFGKFMN
jgi:signal recognition particle subunit SRP54